MRQQLVQLFGVARQARLRVGAGAGTVAEHVIGDDLVMRGQTDDLAAPHFLVQAHPVNQHHG